jgi:hypothetical protein
MTSGAANVWPAVHASHRPDRRIAARSNRRGRLGEPAAGCLDRRHDADGPTGDSAGASAARGRPPSAAMPMREPEDGRRAAKGDEVDGLLGRIRELVRPRDRLRRERPGDVRIAGRSAEIERLKQQLAEAVRRELASTQATSPV